MNYDAIGMILLVLDVILVYAILLELVMGVGKWTINYYLDLKYLKS